MSTRKNQHVVKHPDGWAVKGAGNNKATKVTKTQKKLLRERKKLPVINALIPRFTVEMEKLELAIAMETTLIHQKTRSKEKVWLLQRCSVISYRI